jgi:hypothetical protein
MAIVTRHFVARLTPSGSTEYHDGHFWTEDRDDAEEFRTYAKAQRRADRIGGEVFRFQRFSNLPDTYAVPFVSTVRGHNSSSRLERHFIVRGASLSSGEGVR